MKPYEEGGGMDAIFRPSAGETIIGTEQSKRSTKTFISSEKSGITLALIENHARAVIKNLQRLHRHQYGEDLEPREIVERYSAAKRWVELHQMLVEHFASTNGFSVTAVVQLAAAKLMERHNNSESSIRGAPSDGNAT